MHSLIRTGKVFLYGEPIGILSQDTDGFHFYYYPDYAGIPLSLSLPVEQKAFHSKTLFPYFASLVPEGWLRKTYAELQKTDEDDLLGLLLNNGENMLGAIQILREKQ
ncbi:hypothetical protein QV08_02700 [Gallibacterium salpingitidis]|uniref:HipA N-terminal subdomain 1 domain-containing protein n=1 Tax=Gallibacterium salpingitidis TaxID=505341 RepID=A0A1A7Q5I0_9PAST|nr:HipA N-terminal domain-containing protein [Gallibacterium salpingitidis]OBW94160.1 hypothetical protein QS62_06935 [Gallibacterium salpingitidis]OBX09157.1 hypothetical protein QV08_02700 [Gallibacterium salpingitidis]